MIDLFIIDNLRAVSIDEMVSVSFPRITAVCIYEIRAL